MPNVITGQRVSYTATGHTAMLDYAVYFEAPMRETIDVCILKHPPGGMPVMWGSFQLWLKDFDTRWLDQFWTLFLSSNFFRKQVQHFYGLDVGNRSAERQRLALGVSALEAQGFPVCDARVGGCLQRTYIQAAYFPGELLEVSQSAGFMYEEDHLFAGGMLCQPKANLSAGAALTQLLGDWAEGQLQPGTHYRHWQGDIRPFSLVPSPIKLPSVHREPAVATIVDKSVKGRLQFSDLGQLRSGRDAFSSVKLPGLLAHLGEKEIPEMVRSFDTQDAQKILRWMCRGLPEGLAIQKWHVDTILTEQQRQKSKQQQADKKNGDVPTAP